MFQFCRLIVIVFLSLFQDGGRFPFNPTSYPGYVWHCHMLEHEDEEMMRPFILSAPHSEVVYDTILFKNKFADLSLVDIEM